MKTNVIEGPWPGARRLELKPVPLRLSPTISPESADGMVHDAVARMVDGMARLQALGETYMPELTSLTTLDQALAEVDHAVRRLRLKIEAHKRRAYSVF